MEKTIVLTKRERMELRRQARSRTGRAEVARRARVILLLAGGATWNAVCHAVGCSRGFVATWSRRFAAERLAGLYRRHRGQVPLRTDGNPYPGSHAAGAGRRLHALEHPQAGGAARGQSHAGHRHVREIAQFGVQLARGPVRGPIDWLAWGVHANTLASIRSVTL